MFSFRSDSLVKVLFTIFGSISLFANDIEPELEAVLSSVEDDSAVAAVDNVEGVTINFHNVPVQEFIRFVSRISDVNFIYDHKDLQFNVSLFYGKPVASASVLRALIHMLRMRGLSVMEQDGCYVIHKTERTLSPLDEGNGNQTASSDMVISPFAFSEREFMVYKLQYQQGSDVEGAIKKIGQDMQMEPGAPVKLLRTIHSLQWVKATNSLLASGDEPTIASLRKLIESIDVPLKQVFIEVLVIETDVRGSLDFGLEWAASGTWDNRVGGGISNLAPSRKGPSPFGSAMQSNGQDSLLTGLSQIPLTGGFNLGVIGNMILHKGKSFFSLGSLVSALQVDGNSSIVLNQKIITQDNKNSKIFVGDNIPFTGSVTQTVGASQQTTSNIDYRNVGVSLSITPMLGDDDIITLEIKQEISEALPEMGPANSLSDVGGIRTTKTDMSTQVHVPDQHFLVLTGMMRNHQYKRKSQIPCLGGLPLIGAAFSKNSRNDDRKNIIVYVRPQIIRNIEDYKRVTQAEENVIRRESAPVDFDRALNQTKETP
jgi:type III secretion protein C